LFDHGVRFRAIAGVLLNRAQQAAVFGRGASVMQEEDALANASQRRGAKLIRTSASLRDVVR
jgi:hypothetical protein